MQNNPWHNTSGKPILFILDASNKVERELLLDWLTRSKPESSKQSPPLHVSHVVVPILENPEKIPTQALEVSLTTTGDTLLIPLRVVWKTTLDDKDSTPRIIDLVSGNVSRPKRSKAEKIIKNNPQRAICIAAEAASLKVLRDKLEYRLANGLGIESLPEFVAGQAGLALDVAERRLKGSRYKVPRQVAKNLQASKVYKENIHQLVDNSKVTSIQVQKQSQTIFKELIATPRCFWIDVIAVLNRYVLSLGYNNEIIMDPKRLQRFKQIARDHPTAFLWTHKSHVDGFAIASILYENDFPAPHVLGGVNMAFAGLGFLARRAGAIFIRRSFKDDNLYKIIFRHYLGYLLEKRFPLTWAFEGTRSRVGKLMPPRYGVLKYVADAAKVFNTKDIHIIPVAMNYDLIGDVKDYAAEQSGGVKRPESLSWFISYLRSLRQPMGRVYVDFGEPVILNENQLDDLSIAKVAFQVGVEANRVSPITFPSLVLMILSGASPRALTQSELLHELSTIVLWARRRRIKISPDLSKKNIENIPAGLLTLAKNGVINHYDTSDNVYRVTVDQQTVANYYRNTIIHHFVNKAIIELAVLQTIANSHANIQTFWDTAEKLRDLFKFEFFYTPTDAFRQELNIELERYDKHWQQTLLNEKDNNFLKTLTPLVAHSTLLSFVEAYRVVADVFTNLEANTLLDEKSCVAQAFKYGRQAFLQRRISSPASLGKLLFQNGFKLMNNLKLNVTINDDADIIAKRKNNSARFRSLAHQLERIRIEALPSDF